MVKRVKEDNSFMDAAKKMWDTMGTGAKAFANDPKGAVTAAGEEIGGTQTAQRAVTGMKNIGRVAGDAATSAGETIGGTDTAQRMAKGMRDLGKDPIGALGRVASDATGLDKDTAIQQAKTGYNALKRDPVGSLKSVGDEIGSSDVAQRMAKGVKDIGKDPVGALGRVASDATGLDGETASQRMKAGFNTIKNDTDLNEPEYDKQRYEREQAIDFARGAPVRAALESGDVNALSTVINATGNAKDANSFIRFVDSTPTQQNAFKAATNLGAADRELDTNLPTGEGTSKFMVFANGIVKTVLQFFNKGVQTVVSKVTSLTGGDNATSAWSTQTLGDSGVTYGGAIGIGIAASFLVFITYKIVNKFRKKNTAETAVYAFTTLDEIITESNVLFKSLNNVYLIEGVDDSEKSLSTLNSARTPAMALHSFLAEGPKEDDGKIISFLKKFKPFIGLVGMGVAGVALGTIATRAMASAPAPASE